MPIRHYGHVAGVPVGDTFPNREALSQAGVHRQTQGGITGGKDGVQSIVLNAGYADDVDHGDEVIYTGHGGRNPNTGRQESDQEFAVGNRGLAVCCDSGLPVRVCRGPKVEAPYGTVSGYRYDGLYRVEEYWHDVGQDGFRIWRFCLRAIPGEATVFGPTGPAQPLPMPTPPAPKPGTPTRVPTTTLRIVRDTVLSATIKAAHDYRCQVCDIQLAVPTGFYAEAAHVQPLGAPHNGPDVSGNVLCLCPNHHVLVDKGTIWIDSEMVVQPLGTPLKRPDVHPVDAKYTAYHAGHFRPQ
jgi:putative restriction endonuclease